MTIHKHEKRKVAKAVCSACEAPVLWDPDEGWTGACPDGTPHKVAA